MHWIDHDFLPDIGGAVERFIVNRHADWGGGGVVRRAN
jgi:hypothetical protein